MVGLGGQRSRIADLGELIVVITSAVRQKEIHAKQVTNRKMSLFSRNREAWLRRAEAFSSSRSGVVLLALIAFADSSILPVLPDLLFIPMLLLRPDRRWLLTGACVVASSVGALVGYGIGHLAWTTLGQALVEIYGQADNFQRYRKLVEDWGLNWSRLSGQKFRVDKWSLCRG